MSNISQKEKSGYIIGRDAFAKISAVEGIYLTKEIRKDFQMFEEKGLSPKDRRDALSKKYTR
jgi:hypothetical protein